MASFCRSALMAGSRSFAAVSKTIAQKAPTSRPLSPPLSPTARHACSASRAVSALGGVESLMPLHSTIASARLISNIAVDSSCWSWLSLDFAVPR
ncbi:uncharacterized protein LOC116198025 [Punica granatum]|uniref:Uncharacterized protein LOC116198025 n=1 Tax=Punica granatum TaxID=22663 RepID=A0A6P8CLA8_PUNGR|nr:uncharacterized protein LOC116198025 [Punica granatum]